MSDNIFAENGVKLVFVQSGFRHGKPARVTKFDLAFQRQAKITASVGQTKLGKLFLGGLGGQSRPIESLLRRREDTRNSPRYIAGKK